MQISDILHHKQSDQVWTVPQDATVRELLALLAEHHIGAAIVASPDEVEGIISERDIVRRLHTDGADILDTEVSMLMTRDVISCAPSDSVNAVATLMTEQRIRHLPVVDNGALVGVVSIGDVVSSRIRELQTDRDQLEQYITG
jgi:CBS domain-containing protein